MVQTALRHKVPIGNKNVILCESNVCAEISWQREEYTNTALLQMDCVFNTVQNSDPCILHSKHCTVIRDECHLHTMFLE